MAERSGGGPRRAAAALVALLVVGFVVGERSVRRSIGAEPYAEEPFLAPWMDPSEAALRWRYSSEGGRNSLGFASPERGPKADGIRRVLFLGDSLLFRRTLYGGPIPAVAEAILNDLAPGDPYEVVNAAVPGYTTFQQLELLKMHLLGPDTDADRVVVGFVLNDVFSPYLHRPRAEPLQELAHEPAATRYRFSPYGPPGWVFGRSYLAHLLVDRARSGLHRVIGRAPYPFELQEDLYLAWKPYGMVAAAGHLQAMKDALDAVGVPMSVVVFPARDQLDPAVLERDPAYVLSPQRRLGEALEESGIPSLDLFDTLRALGGPEQFTDAVHLTPDAATEVATAVARHVADLEGLP